MDYEFPSVIALSDEDMEVLEEMCLYEKGNGNNPDPAVVLSNALRTARDLAKADYHEG